MVAARGLFKRITAAARTLTAKLRPRQPGMIGTPPSARPMWHDPAAHARDFAERYAEPLDQCVAVRMEELGLTNDEIGMPDDDRGLRWAAFHPLGKQGGYNSPDGRLVVESGLLNFDLLKPCALRSPDAQSRMDQTQSGIVLRTVHFRQLKSHFITPVRKPKNALVAAAE